jgi:hypothetical protein
MSTRKTTAEKIEAARIEKAQKEAEIKRLLQLQKSEERKARNHRLCERGGIVEKLLPDLVRLDKEQFDTFVQKTLLSGYAEKVIRGLVKSEQPEDDTTQNSNNPTAKPAQSAAAPGVADGSRTENVARQAG